MLRQACGRSDLTACLIDEDSMKESKPLEMWRRSKPDMTGKMHGDHEHNASEHNAACPFLWQDR